ncbi:MAG: metallophosphoesterase family protein, partial [Candidatus Hinthialibacter sp.]
EFLDQCEQFINIVVETMPKSLPDDIPRMLVAHLTVERAKLGGYRGSMLMTDDIQITPANLAQAGYDYVALGHIHHFQNLTPDEETPVVYSGSIDRVDFGERDEEKGCVITHIRRGGAEVEFTPIHVRPFIEISVETPAGADITEAILEEIEAEEIEEAVVRVKFQADDKEIQRIDMKRIHEALKPAYHKAGFIRIPRETFAKRRSLSLSSDIVLADAMAAYLREHEEWKEDGEDLLSKAKEIEKTVLSARENE